MSFKNFRRFKQVASRAALATPAIYLSSSVIEVEPKKEISDGQSADVAVNVKNLQNINYQNRLRKYSTPDKLFRFFATVKLHPSGDIYMTVEDFVRSITPDSLQPDGLGLDEYRKMKVENLDNFLQKYMKKYPSIQKTEIFHQITQNGLISFSDYIFLLSVISTSEKNWGIMFKLFDQDGDGSVDKKEFAQVIKLAQNRTSVGDRHRDTKNNQARDILTQNSAISEYFFGKKGDDKNTRKLLLKDFLEFHRVLKSDILRLQFDKENPDENDRISKISFAKMILCYIERASTFSEMERLKRILTHPYRKSQGVTFKQVDSLFRVLGHIDDIEMALEMHTAAGKDLDQKTFKHVAIVVANEELDSTVIDVVWAVLDEDESGGLSYKEFIKTVKARTAFGLDTPKDTGLWNFFYAAYHCGKRKVVSFFK